MDKLSLANKIIKRLTDECIMPPSAYVVDKLRQILKEEL